MRLTCSPRGGGEKASFSNWLLKPQLFAIMPNKEAYKPRCEFYTRFTTSEDMPDSKRWNTYFRSRFSRTVGSKPSEKVFHPHKPGKTITEASKTGTYYSPFHFKAYRDEVKPIKRKQTIKYPDNAYDDLLAYQRKIANYMVSEMGKKKLNWSVNADNDYTCVLIKFPKPPAAKEADWVNLVILHFVAITNHLSEEKGLNAELVRRSGFGHLRPSVCETAPSFRINVGFIPTAYADLLVEALEKTHALLCGDNREVFNHQPNLPSVTEKLDAYNQAKKLKDKKQLALKETLWDTLWTRFDSCGGSVVKQGMRCEITAEWLVNGLIDGFRQHPDAFDTKKKLKSVVVYPWLRVLRNVSINGTVLSVKPPVESLPSYQWQKPAEAIDDPEFTQIINRLHTIFDDVSQPQKTLQGLHEHLEAASKKMFFNPVEMDHEDGCGSDSECDDDIQIGKKKAKVYAKKFITATGMRAIQLAFAAVKLYLQQDLKLNFRNLQIETGFMYYETEDALTKHAIPIKLESVNDLAAQVYKLHFFDLNHCNTTHKKTPEVTKQIPDTFPICVLDATSASMEKMATAGQNIFKKNPNVSTVIFVSSGLKNEQAGSDINPYGTLRIFSRTQKERDDIYEWLVALEEKAKYEHPGISHLLRKNAKERKLTPTNLGIFKHMPHQVERLEKQDETRTLKK